MKKYFCVSLIVFCCAALNAQKNTQKGLAALSQANFGTAKTYFYKELKKDSLCAAFGLSNYYLTPFGYQADSAFAYLTFFEGAYATLNAKSKTKLQTDLALQDNTAQQLFHQLATSELQVATRAPQIEALELYMERYGQKYPDYKKIVVALRDSLAFDNALKAQSSSAMQAFLVMYPNAVQQQKAKANYDLLLYQERTQHDTEAELLSTPSIHTQGKLGSGFITNMHKLAPLKHLRALFKTIRIHLKLARPGSKFTASTCSLTA